MGLGLALIVMGVLILTDRMGTGYGLREGWPWVVVALGIGGLIKNVKSFAAWITAIIGVLILGAKYYSVHLNIPGFIRPYILPAILILLGILSIWRYKKD